MARPRSLLSPSMPRLIRAPVNRFWYCLADRSAPAGISLQELLVPKGAAAPGARSPFRYQPGKGRMDVSGANTTALCLAASPGVMTLGVTLLDDPQAPQSFCSQVSHFLIAP